MKKAWKNKQKYRKEGRMNRYYVRFDMERETVYILTVFKLQSEKKQGHCGQ